MIKHYCDWCGREAPIDGGSRSYKPTEDRPLQLVPFMSSGYCGEMVCTFCEQAFTAAYEKVRSDRMKKFENGPY